MPARRTTRAFVPFLAVLVVGVAGYHVIEGWSLSDSAWMVFVTLTTIGFGEVHPLSGPGRLFTIALVAGGLGVGTYALSQVGRAIVEREFARALRERRRRRMLARMRDHFIVVGFGRLGRVVAHELRDGGHPVCVVERDPAVVPQEPEAEGFPVIHGDGAEDAVLREAGIERARGLAVTASPEAEAIFITLSARQLNPTVPILTRVDSDEAAVKARRAGATQIVSPSAMGGWRMALGLVRPHTMTLIDLVTLAAHPDFMLDEIAIDERSPHLGHTIRELQVGQRHGVLVVGIRRRDGRFITNPKGDTRIEGGDVLIVTGEPRDVRRFAAALLGEDEGNGTAPGA